MKSSKISYKIELVNGEPISFEVTKKRFDGNEPKFIMQGRKRFAYVKALDENGAREKVEEWQSLLAGFEKKNKPQA